MTLRCKGGFPMKNKLCGSGFRVTGLILGVVATVCGVTAVVFSAIGLHQAHLCKRCKKGAEYR